MVDRLRLAHRTERSDQQFLAAVDPARALPESVREPLPSDNDLAVGGDPVGAAGPARNRTPEIDDTGGRVPPECVRHAAAIVAEADDDAAVAVASVPGAQRRVAWCRRRWERSEELPLGGAQPFPRLEPCVGRVDTGSDDGLAVAAHGDRFLAADVDHARGGHPVEAAAGPETADDDGPVATHRAWHSPRGQVNEQRRAVGLGSAATLTERAHDERDEQK